VSIDDEVLRRLFGTADVVDAEVAGPVPAASLVAGIQTSGRCTLTLPYERPPAALVANGRPNRYVRARETRMVRGDVTNLARAAGLHRIRGIRHVTVCLVWAPGDRRRRDEDNLYPLLKVCCDALARGPRRDWIGLELVPDDTPEHMTKLAPRIEPPPAPRGLRLEVALDLGQPEPANTATSQPTGGDTT
jgi:crossover junction endodeoxyribonuclease RusA